MVCGGVPGVCGGVPGVSGSVSTRGCLCVEEYLGCGGVPGVWRCTWGKWMCTWVSGGVPGVCGGVPSVCVEVYIGCFQGVCCYLIYASMEPMDVIFIRYSTILVEFCTKCDHARYSHSTRQ